MLRRINHPWGAAILLFVGLLGAGLVAFGDAAMTRPSTQPAVASTLPATNPSTNPSPFTINFKDMPLDDVLSYFSETIGFEVMKEGPIDARITMMSKQPVTAGEAVTMLDAALTANGFVVSQDGKILHIVARDKAKKGNVPVHFGNDPADVADSGELITQVVPISNISAAHLKEDLKPLISPDSDVTSNDGSNSIIITDTSSAIRRLVLIISELDKHEAKTTEIHVVQLKHASATEMAKLIGEFFKEEPAAQPSPQQMQRAQMMAQQGGGPPPAPSGGSERHGASVTVDADERTNALLIMASEETFKSIDAIIQQLDTDNPNPAPSSDVKIFTLKFAAADATAKLINTMFSDQSGSTGRYVYYFGGGGSDDQDKKIKVNAVADQRSNTLVVTGPVDKLKAIELLVNKLDAAPAASQAIRAIHLKHADAFNVAGLLMDTFEPKKGSSDTERRVYYFEDSSPDDSQKVREQHVNVTSDERTNTVLISAPQDLQDTIEKIVKDLDSDSSEQDTFFIYHLRNAQANHLAYTLNVLFGNIQAGAQANANGGGSQLNQNQTLQQQFQQQQQNLPGQSSESGSNNGSNSSNSTQNRNNRNFSNNSLSGVSQATSALANDLTHQAFFVAEPDTNAILVTTASKYEPQVRGIVDDLDRPLQQVLIRMLIAEVSRDDADDIGTDYSVLNLRASGKGLKAMQTFGLPTNGLVVSLLEDNLMATIHALETHGRLDVLSRPYILATDNQNASITVGQSVPFITESRLDSLNNTINTVQYQDIGIIMNVTPHVNPDGLVILDVSPEISQLTQTSIQLSPGVSSPVFQRRSASSRVQIMDGQTIVIGGLMQDQNNSTLQQIPILGSLPLIGAFFSRTQIDKTKTELLVFLSPHVVAAPEELRRASDDERKSAVLTPDAVAPGVFQEHMRALDRGTPSSRPVGPVSPIDSIPLTAPAN